MKNPNSLHNHQQILWLLLISILISNISFCACEIKNTRIIDDARPMILFERFGFAQDGHVAISIKDVSWKSKHHNAKLDPTSMGFFLVRDISFPRILNESEYTEGFCVLSSQFVKLIFRLDKLAGGLTYNGSVAIEEPDKYNLIFGNCQPEFEVTMNVHTEMYNVRNDGTKDFLPAGQTLMPKLYFLLFLIYTIFLGTWIFICIKQRSTVDRIHLIMCALLLFKALKLICASEDKMYITKTGTPHGWDVAFYVFGFFKGVILFTVIVLIGTGWSFLKPYLQEREKKVLMVIIPLQVLENVASVVISETGPAMKDWLMWTQLFLIFDVACCCAVLFPIIWSIKSLREASKTDGKAARNLGKLTLFKQFYIVVILFLYFTRVMVPAIGTVVSYRYEWVAVAAAEGGSLGFYLFIFYNFQPIEKNPYLVIDDEEEATAGHILEADDSFDL
ncbi:protein GPR107-like [Camellia sinensis]|uniref:protein GPR107-like n=1 Tax=Camellia sinensis TaxID=4442 RepID=UPI001035C12E|nr:protein GPR107-like [Camellia sinensis]